MRLSGSALERGAAWLTSLSVAGTEEPHDLTVKSMAGTEVRLSRSALEKGSCMANKLVSGRC